ncbi:type II and III secretion system protein [bacterium]|nr:type II and III secretion system protein [bacterium]
MINNNPVVEFVRRKASLSLWWGTLFMIILGISAGSMAEKKHSITKLGEENDKRVSLNLVDTDIPSALRMLAKISGLNIVIGKGIDGEVSARLENVTVKEALGSILHSCGYRYEMEGSVVRVSVAKKEFLGVDSKTPQVLIKSKIIEVDLGKNSGSGVDWKLISSKLGNDFSLNAESSFGQEESGLILNLFSGDVESVISMIEENSETRILSEPSVVALDRHEAKIMVGDKIAYQQSFGQASAGITTTSIQFEDVGIKLFVTPYIKDGYFVLLDIHVEVSSVKEWRTLSNGDEIPIISTKETSTRVMVRNNSTLIIGGLIGKNRVEKVRKVPLLGDIPLLGYFFKRESVDTSRSELTVFITPRIMGQIAGN